MSVIEALKGKLNNVQHDISIGLKTISIRKKSVILPNATLPDTFRNSVNFDAGADLLNKYQGNWADISRNAADNAKRAEVVDGSIARLQHALECQNAAVSRLLVSVSTLPDIAAALNITVAKLGSLQSSLSDVEQCLILLEDICDQQDLHQRFLHHEQLLQQHTARKREDLEHTKIGLATNHAEKAAGYEARMRGMLIEKQQSLEDTHRQDMDHYRQYGSHQYPVSSSPASNLDIADIDIGGREDGSMLDEFLGEGPDEGVVLDVDAEDYDVLSSNSDDDRPEDGPSPPLSCCDDTEMTMYSNQATGSEKTNTDNATLCTDTDKTDGLLKTCELTAKLHGRDVSDAECSEEVPAKHLVTDENCNSETVVTSPE